MITDDQCDIKMHWYTENQKLKGLLEWKPIESAPKDGTHILACDEKSWRYGRWVGPPTVVHYWSNPGEEGFYTSVNEFEPQNPFTATHWMPLQDFRAEMERTKTEGEG